MIQQNREEFNPEVKMGNYSGRIVALGTDVLLMAFSFVLVIVCERMAHTNLIDILVVLLVVRFLYDLRKPCRDFCMS